MIKTMKKSKLIILSILLAIACSFFYYSTNFLYAKQSTESQTLVRDIEITKNEIDYQSILEEFENSNLKTEGTLTTFVGYKSINLAELDGFDLVSDLDVEDTKLNVKYNFSYDNESNIVTLSAELKDEFGEIYIDTLTGAAFINEDGEIDAVMNVDGEGILLSEMQDSSMIANCGWFSRLIKNVVKITVVAVTVAAVAVTTAAVVVATAGVAAPALVAAGIGITTSAATTASLAIGATAGVIYAATIGMSAVKAGTALAETIAEGVEQVVDKVSGKIICLILSGVEYATVAYVESSTKDLKINEYKFVVFVKGIAYITISTFDLTKAVWGLRLGLNTYCIDKNGAKLAAQDAGNGLEPRFHTKHNLDTSGNPKFGIYFDHYHPFLNSVTYDALGFEIPVGHSFFGVPSINI